MKKSACAVIKAVGLDNTPFNMEFFYRESDDSIALLEINARISKSHSPLFDNVEGVPHNEVMIDIALGKRPDYPAKRGRFRYAAKFMPRLYGHHDEVRVAHAPPEEDVQAIEERFPGAKIQLHLREGMRLGDMHHHDAYSYELAAIFIGANSRAALRRDFHAIMEALDLRFER
jgi:biotin carboxylase